MPHASVIVPSVLGAAAAAAAFEVTVFRPWRERHAPQGLHVLLGEELQKFGRTAEGFARQAGQHADELGSRVKDEFRRVGEDMQHAAGELRDGFLELTGQGHRPHDGFPAAAAGGPGRRLGGGGDRRGSEDEAERRGLMRQDSWDEHSKTSAIDRPMYAPAETEYDPDDEQTLASLQQLHHRRRTGRSGLARDDADNVTLRDSARGGPSTRPGGAPFGPSLLDDEDEGTAAFRAHRSLLGEAGTGSEARGANTIFDLEDFSAARDAFGFEDIQSPHHALGSPSIAASDVGGDDLFSNASDAHDAVHLSNLDVSTLSLGRPVIADKALPAAPMESTEPKSSARSAASQSGSSDANDDEWHRPSALSAAPSVSGSDGELVTASAAASEAGESVGQTASEGWIDLEPGTPDNLSPPSSPRAAQRQIQG